jgi:ATP-dependent helicase HepA
LNSNRPAVADPLIEAIRRQDADVEFEAFFIRMLDHLGAGVEELGGRSYLLKSGPAQNASLPGLTPDGAMFTFDRARALAREDIGFLTADHPLVRAAIDAILGIETGNSAFGIWKTAPGNSFFLETHFVVESIAPAHLHADRWLPATPVRIAVDQSLSDRSADGELQDAELAVGDIFKILDTPALKKKHLPAMLAKANELAAVRRDAVVQSARQRAAEQLDAEIARLEDLSSINNHIHPAEIESLRTLKNDLLAAIDSAGLRLDALRLVLGLAGQAA